MAQLVIRQFDVYLTPAREQGVAMVIVLQSHLLSALDSLLVAPVFPASTLRGGAGVFVEVAVEGETYVADLALIANLPARGLTRFVVSAAEHEDEFRRGLDRLFTGF